MSKQSARDMDSQVRSRIPHFAEYYDLLKYEIDPLGGFRLIKNQNLPHVRINDLGFRGSNFSGRETLLLLGDSVTFGVGAASDDACFSSFLAQALQVPVANASVRAYRTFQHFVQLPHLLDRLPQTRVVVLWVGYVDLLYWTTTGGLLEGAFQFERKYSADPVIADKLPFPLRVLSKGMIAIFNRYIYSRHDRRTSEKGTVEDLARYVVLYVRAIVDLCSARNVKVQVLVQPFVRSRPVNPELREIADFYSEKAKSTCGASWYDLATVYVAALIRELQNIESAEIFDLQPLFSEDDFLDQVHIRDTAFQNAMPSVAKLITKEMTIEP